MLSRDNVPQVNTFKLLRSGFCLGRLLAAHADIIVTKILGSVCRYIVQLISSAYNKFDNSLQSVLFVREEKCLNSQRTRRGNAPQAIRDAMSGASMKALDPCVANSRSEGR